MTSANEEAGAACKPATGLKDRTVSESVAQAVAQGNGASKPYSFGDYIRRLGWKLTPLQGKAPYKHGWKRNKLENAITDPEVADQLPAAGLLHEYSGTAVLDIDDIPLARQWFEERGISLDAMLNDPANVHIKSGRPGRDKLLFKR